MFPLVFSFSSLFYTSTLFGSTHFTALIQFCVMCVTAHNFVCSNVFFSLILLLCMHFCLFCCLSLLLTLCRTSAASYNAHYRNARARSPYLQSITLFHVYQPTFTCTRNEFDCLWCVHSITMHETEKYAKNGEKKMVIFILMNFLVHESTRMKEITPM